MSREEYLKEQITKIQCDFNKLAKEIQDDGNACTKTMFSEYVAFELEKAFKDFEDKQIQTLKTENAELKARLQNCIEPKFKKQDYIFYIGENGVVFGGYIYNIQYDSSKGFSYFIPNIQADVFRLKEQECFTTKEQAEAKLKELQ